MGMVELLLYVFMAATVLVLGAGLVVTYKGGKFAAKYSNSLMRWRVAFQSLAIIVLAILMWLEGS